MTIINKKVMNAIKMLERKTGSTYQLRTECTRPDLYKSEKYFLYERVNKYGYSMPGTYGRLVNGFATQKAFIENVNAFGQDDNY